MCPFILLCYTIVVRFLFMDIEILKAKKGVRFITLTNDVGMEVILSSFGASIYSLKMDLENMVLTPKSFDTFFTSGKYYGMTVGRIAGRVANGLLKVNDKEYQLSQNEGSNCLHGGKDGISTKNWRTQVEKTKKLIIVTFHLTTKNGDSGFNGKAEYKVIYTLHADSNVLEINYDASCKEDTYFNLTNHSYWNLGHDKDVLNHKLRIKANEVSTFNEDDFTINGFVPLADTVFDFREGKVLRKDMAKEELHTSKWLNGYDHRFHLVEVEATEANIALSNGNYRMSIFTDFDGVQIYTNGFANDDQFIEEDYDCVYRGIAIEPTSLYPEFIKKGDHYTHFIKYVFRRKTDELY